MINTISKLSIIALTLLISCTFIEKKNDKNKLVDTRIEEKTCLMKVSYETKKLSFLPSLTNDSILFINEKCFVYYYTEQDCSSCISDGVDICTDLSLVLQQKFATIISTGRKSNYSNSFLDKDRLIQEKLVSIYSPVFFIIDKNFEIVDLVLCDSNQPDNRNKIKSVLLKYLE